MKKYVPNHMLSEEDRKVQDWRKCKRKMAQELNKDRNDQKLRGVTEASLVKAAKAVVAAWASKTLASKVRSLDLAIYDYEEARKE